MIRSVVSGAALHAAHGKELDLHKFAGQLCPSLVPVDLSLLAPAVLLRNVDLAAAKAKHFLAFSDPMANGGLRDRMLWMLLAQANPDPVGRVTLLARRLLVRF